MSYIVKNCPAILRMTKLCDAYERTRDNPQFCKDIEDCVIKQVINRCLYYQNKVGRMLEHRAGLLESTNNILELFDIEEINK